MPDLTIRPAQLDDTQAISQAFIQTVSVWQRLDAHGRVEEVSYDDLSIYERWLHGGHWMSVETGAIYLSHLIKAGVMTLAAYDGAALVGYVEAYPSDEPAPYGEHLHIGHLHAGDAATRTALLRHTLKAATGHYRRVTVSFSAYDQETRAFFINHDFYELAQMRQYAISAQTGQGFYKAMPTTASPPQSAIKDWHMLSGRTQSAAHHWHHLWPRHWDAIAEITAQKTHRLQLNAAGQDAFVYIQQQLYVTRAADVYCWSPKPLTGQILIALRDWAYRADYRTLNMTLAPKDAQLLGSAAEEMPYQQAIFAFDLR
jgi:hypothetical protein